MTLQENTRAVNATIRSVDRLVSTELRTFNTALNSAYLKQEEKLLTLVENANANREAIQVELKKLNEIKTSLNIINPEMEEVYGDRFEQLLQTSTQMGYNLADELVLAYDVNSTLAPQFGEVALEAAILQAKEGMERLSNHSQTVASEINQIVTKGIINGDSVKTIQDRLRGQLGILKSRAENIARTEVMSSLNHAAHERYRGYGVEYVQLQALMDNRTTPECQFRHMKVIRIDESQPPYHFRCRTTALPYKAEWLTQEDINFARSEVARASESALNQQSIFEKLNNIPKPNPIEI
jgi:SPP1 gp7 family putative phage head morphogenesis protein